MYYIVRYLVSKGTTKMKKKVMKESNIGKP